MPEKKDKIQKWIFGNFRLIERSLKPLVPLVFASHFLSFVVYAVKGYDPTSLMILYEIKSVVVPVNIGSLGVLTGVIQIVAVLYSVGIVIKILEF